MAGLVRCRPALGTYVQVAVRDELAEAVLLAGVEAAFEAIAEVDRLMSFHRADSELSRLNAAAAGETLCVHPALVEVLRRAREIHDLSDGVFDPGVADRLVAWSLLPSCPPPRTRTEASLRGGSRSSAASVSSPSSIRDVDHLDERHVRVRRATCLDLGGIAKGYAVDRAIEALRGHGLAQADVNAGGDLRVLGEPRPIQVREPADPRVLRTVGALGDGALATSAIYFSLAEAEWPSGDAGAVGTRGGAGSTEAGAVRSALVDATTRAPVLDPRSFTVIASDCMAADALTKVLAATGRLPAGASRWDARALVL